MIYSSKQNQLIKQIASLKDKKGRKQHGLYLVEGIKMVSEAIKFNMPVKYIVLTEGVSFDFSFTGFEVLTVTQAVFEYLSDEKTPQGVMAVISMPDLTVKPPKNNALILEGVSDPGNVGTIIRTAVASGYDTIYLINAVDPFSPKAVRSSMSGIFSINLCKCTLDEALKAIDGFDLIVADMGGENLFDFKPVNKYCIAVGNEANGISDELKDSASVILSIPMSDKTESLNVAVAASIMMYKLKY